MTYGEGVLYNFFFTEWRHWVSQNEVWGRGSYITLVKFSPSDDTAFHRIQMKREEPTFIMISNWKKFFGFYGLYKNNAALLSHLGDHRQRSRNALKNIKNYWKRWRLMDSHDPERLSSVRKRTSSVRLTWLTTEERTSQNPWFHRQRSPATTNVGITHE